MGRLFARMGCAAAVSLLLAACQSPQMVVGAIAPANLAAPSGVALSSTAMQPGAAVEIPSGYAAFCKRDPADCAVGEGEADQVALTPAIWDKLLTTNVALNAA